MARKVEGVPRQTEKVQVLLTKQELAFLDKVCHTLMCSRSQYFRNCLLGALVAQLEAEKKGEDWLAYVEKSVIDKLQHS